MGWVDSSFGPREDQKTQDSLDEGVMVSVFEYGEQTLQEDG